MIIQDDVEMLSVPFLQMVERIRDLGESVTVLMRTDDEIRKEYHAEPLNPQEDRIVMALEVAGVDEVICDGMRYTRSCGDNESDSPKMFGVGYVPGTYDVLHTGHLENILEARKLCDIVVIGVNSDDLVFHNKGKRTRQSESTRKWVLQHIEGVQFVIIADTNDKKVIGETIREMTGGRKMQVIVLGEDLKGKSINSEALEEGVVIHYTRRPAAKMLRVSSTHENQRISELEQALNRERRETRSSELGLMLLRLRSMTIPLTKTRNKNR